MSTPMSDIKDVEGTPLKPEDTDAYNKALSALSKPALRHYPLKCDTCGRFCSPITAKMYRDWESEYIEEVECITCYSKNSKRTYPNAGDQTRVKEL